MIMGFFNIGKLGRETIFQLLDVLSKMTNVLFMVQRKQKAKTCCKTVWVLGELRLSKNMYIIVYEIDEKRKPTQS